MAMVVGCVPAQPTTPTAAPAAKAAQPTAAAKFGPKFQALLSKAKQGDGRLRAGISAYTPEFIRAMEKQFGEEFGINITLENEPGHGSREIPPKMVQAQKVGKGLVDWIDGGNPSNFAPLMARVSAWSVNSYCWSCHTRISPAWRGRLPA